MAASHGDAPCRCCGRHPIPERESQPTTCLCCRSIQSIIFTAGSDQSNLDAEFSSMITYSQIPRVKEAIYEGNIQADRVLAAPPLPDFKLESKPKLPSYICLMYVPIHIVPIYVVCNAEICILAQI